LLVNNAALDVVIGLILLYGAIGAVSAFAGEALAGLLRLKSKTQQGVLRGILDDPSLRKAFADHGIMASVRKASGGHVKGGDFALALLGTLGGSAKVSSFAALETAARALPDSRIRDVLVSHLPYAGGDLVRLHDLLAQWFERTAGQQGGIYNRRLKNISLLAVLLLTGGVNADSLDVANSLWRDGLLREQIIQASASEHALSQSDGGPYKTSFSRSVAPSTTLSYLRGMDEDIRPLPLGWREDLSGAGRRPHGIDYWALKGAGLLLTALVAGFLAGLWHRLWAKLTKPSVKAPSS
jgi:hypothetical protein